MAWWMFISAVVGISIATFQEEEEHMASMTVRAACFTAFVFVLPALIPLVWVLSLWID